MPSRRKGLYDEVESATQELLLEQNIQSLLAPHRTTVLDVPIDRIRPNPFQARTTFDRIDELADAIRAQGFVTRLRIRRDPSAPGFFQLVFGERRLRAAQAAGLATVPSELGEYSDEALIEIGLAENIQRRDLDPLDEARAFRTFIKQRGYTQASLAERIGKPRSYVQERLSLLDMPEDLQHMLAQRPDTIRAAREIARLQHHEQRRPLIEGVLSGTLSKDDVSTLVREIPTRTADGEASYTGKGAFRLTSMPRREHGEQAERGDRFDRALDRDIPALEVIFSRWRQAVPHMQDRQRERLLRYIEKHLAELEELMEALQTK